MSILRFPHQMHVNFHLRCALSDFSSVTSVYLVTYLSIFTLRIERQTSLLPATIVTLFIDARRFQRLGTSYTQYAARRAFVLAWSLLIAILNSHLFALKKGDTTLILNYTKS